MKTTKAKHLGDVQAMRDPRKSVVCSSNLRRAAQTILLGLKNPLDSSDEKIQCLTSLQRSPMSIHFPSHHPQGAKTLREWSPARLAHAAGTLP